MRVGELHPIKGGRRTTSHQRRKHGRNQSSRGHDRQPTLCYPGDIVVRAIAKGKDPRGMPVREVASRELVTIRPDEDLSEALKLMASYQVRRLPVVDEDNTLVGVLAQADIAMEGKEKDFAHMVEEISRTPAGPRV